ncbi:MAG TPA: xanthine dehydrogenase family protein molybdopterin-binding subunit, partial [Roseiarcus sp.]|nr:xanthine dehydrogenase family protein molybdopterin-binding subunit [Roseiarcus sp.]
MKATKFGMGQGVKRVEDVRLVSGRGSYTSDAPCEDALHAVFLRSPHAHARFLIEDVEAARAMPGVKGVYVAADFAELGGLACLAPMRNSDSSLTPLKPYPVMAVDEVAHVGDIVAMVVADTPFQARDAAEAIAVAWDELPLVVDVE